MVKTREDEQYLRWKFTLRVLHFAKEYGAEGLFRKKEEVDTT